MFAQYAKALPSSCVLNHSRSHNPPTFGQQIEAPRFERADTGLNPTIHGENPHHCGTQWSGKDDVRRRVLPREANCLEFVNADLIAAGLSPFQPDSVSLAAGRLMLKRIGELAAARKSFAIETTLANRAYLRYIPIWKSAGYTVKLSFLKLPDAEFAIKRVAQRVALGGHSIPETTIRRRFDRGWKNLKDNYSLLVDKWSLYDASRIPPRLIEKGDNRTPIEIMEDSSTYSSRPTEPAPVQPLDDPDFIGAEAAFKRAAANAVKRARDAGLEPVTLDDPDDSLDT